MRFSACVEYDGTRFSGWQTQAGELRTVQSCVENALSRVADHAVSIVTAGRTDAKVHATHQVIHFDTEAQRSPFAWTRGANRFLSQDVRLHWAVPVDEQFHARFSAVTRSYRFIIHNQSIPSAILRHYVTHEHRQLDVDKMAEAGKMLLGEHDFSAFRAAACQAHSPCRTVLELSVSRQDAWVWLDIKANAFLQHMVRNIAGALIEVGCAKRPVSWIEDLLVCKDRTQAGITATPHGLYLVGVDYPAEYSLPSRFQPIAFWT